MQPRDVADLVDVLGGVTLAGGLYRVFPAASAPAWTAVAVEGFPAFAGKVTVFAADWLGRLLAADSARRGLDGQALVILLEPGTGEALEVPATVLELHSSELLNAADALVAEPFYRNWRDATGDKDALALTECVGYRVPLFLGGADEVSNLERTDMKVYWSLTSQLRGQTQGMSNGTGILRVDTRAPRPRLFRKNRG